MPESTAGSATYDICTTIYSDMNNNQNQLKIDLLGKIVKFCVGDLNLNRDN